MDVIGLGAVLCTDMFIREVVIWELGRTRDTGTFETIVLTKWRCCPRLQHCGT
ncbi:hypothetical protein MTR_4g058540 [Medicago truncatula]|uniref:Uncharacterized protein n=1 Tax=Medicago truncatula TaxID=3880 RepID=G7JNB8_MEDTR|nr:hypothetical protein MTR_4g058540 [Medicago truncatula]